MQNPLKSLPSVNELLESPPLRQMVDRANRSFVVSGVRSFLDNMRSEVQSAASSVHVPTAGELAERIAEWLLRERGAAVRPVINATGVLLHPQFGSAPLAKEAVEAMHHITAAYASVAVDVETGDAAAPARAVEKLLRELSGAEAAAVVNQGSAALLIALASVAPRREVLVARGEMGEAPCGCRLDTVIAAAGARLREVGAANVARSEDYDQALSTDAAAILRTHPTNYAIAGRSESPSLAELAALAHKRNVTLMEDLGPGGLLDAGDFGLGGVPYARESLRAGVDLVLLSGDKLLGGPPCGILLGKKTLIDKIKTHPLYGALQVGKITLAALGATLQLHRDEDRAEFCIPLLSLLATPAENLEHRATHLAPQLAAAESIASAEAVSGDVGLCAADAPWPRIGTWCVALKPAQGDAASLAARLRLATPAIFGRAAGDRLLLDLRSVLPSQDMLIVEALTTPVEEAAATAEKDALSDAE
ncbi:MAG: L-seryl-tRNA(Sec) selenium transferase [Pirellulaceae bacterium]